MGSLVLVGGSIAANYRNGGIAWERLSWALGLKRLGFVIFIVDQLDPSRCIYPPGMDKVYANCLNIGYFRAVVEQFGLGESAVLITDKGESLYGPSRPDLIELAAEADLLVNVAGNVRVDDLKKLPGLRVFIDVDPGFTQLWLASVQPASRLEGHDLFFTIGENVGTPSCDLPSGGVSWRHTRQPVLIDEWPFMEEAKHLGRFTTIARLRGVGPHGDLASLGVEYGQKMDEIAKVIDLPLKIGGQQVFEVALDPLPSETERRLLDAHGWEIADAKAVASDPNSFRGYVQTSGAEFSVAKGAYVETNSGWFSDRTTRYLASGKPAIVQETGFSRNLPVGDGLLSFETLDDAIVGVKRLKEDYDHHCRAARQIAEEHFAAERVLGSLMQEVMG